MAITFDFYQSPSATTNGKEGTERFHARVVGGQTLHTNDLVQHISQRCTLSRGDIQAVISELSTEIALELLNGNRVNIAGIGSFSLSLQAPKDATPQSTHAQNIQVKQIDFRPDHQLKQQVMSHATFERSRDKVHSASISNHEMDALLTDYFKTNSFITRPRLEELCHLTRNTAQRHLKQLVAEGRLINTNTPLHPTYVPVNDFYSK